MNHTALILALAKNPKVRRMTAPNIAIMMRLDSHGPITITELADYLDTTYGDAKQYLHRLERKKLVKRGEAKTVNTSMIRAGEHIKVRAVCTLYSLGHEMKTIFEKVRAV